MSAATMSAIRRATGGQAGLDAREWAFAWTQVGDDSHPWVPEHVARQGSDRVDHHDDLRGVGHRSDDPLEHRFTVDGDEALVRAHASTGATSKHDDGDALLGHVRDMMRVSGSRTAHVDVPAAGRPVGGAGPGGAKWRSARTGGDSGRPARSESSSE